MRYSVASEHGFSDYFYCKQTDDPLFFPHIHSHIEFVFVMEGTLDVTISDVQYQLCKNQLAVIMPYEPHAYTGQARLFVLACPPEYLSEYRQLLTDKVFVPPYVSYGPVHEAIISDIINDDFQDDLKKKAMLYYAVSKLLQDSSLQKAPSYDFDVYRKALVYISENYRENISLKSTAAHVGVTQSHLSRVLNSGDKPGFSEILNALRVHAAKRMLEEENKNISEAAMEAGFGSIRNFNRIFKAYFNCNPTDVKKSS